VENPPSRRTAPCDTSRAARPIDAIVRTAGGFATRHGGEFLSSSPVPEMKMTRSFSGFVRLVFSVSTWWAPGGSTRFSPSVVNLIY
jgi:hypothetical protein